MRTAIKDPNDCSARGKLGMVWNIYDFSATDVEGRQITPFPW